MAKLLSILITLIILTFVSVIPIKAEESLEKFYKATVLAVIERGEETAFGYTNPYQIVNIRFLEGDLVGQEMQLEQGRSFAVDKNQLVDVGDKIVVVQTPGIDDQPQYEIVDRYRLDKIIPIMIAFFVAIILLSKWHGVGSILGMGFSLIVITKYLVPQILAGKDPLVVSILGCLIIMVSTIYLAHGMSKKTTVALVATFVTLVTTGLISVLFVNMAHLTGLGNEDAYSLRLGPTALINFKGLLLGGILIGTLGVLDDVTTSLSASVFELAKANSKLKFKELFDSGLRIGVEHISSLVNTLVLAYAGASLPIFLILIMNTNDYPLWLTLNSELIVEEVVRTLAGSIGLVAAVPLTTFLAAAFVSRNKS